jgi:protocatechuate 3,4-dioxygenase beta subunit
MMVDRDVTRRQLVRVVGAAGAAYLVLPEWLSGSLGTGGAAAATVTACSRLTPELTEGPYWVNTMLRRADVRTNTHTAASAPGALQEGVPLDLTINVLDAGDGCKPLNGVAVDIWHANAHGLYSDESSQQSAGGTTAGDTGGQNFLRGYQVSGADAGVNRTATPGQVSFRTIWPGWYTGRAIHIHVRVRKLSSGGATIAGYTTQIFFSDADNARVLTGAAPYNTRSPRTDPTSDENDTVLQRSDLTTNVVPVTGSLAKGFTATFAIALDASQAATQGNLGRPAAGGPGGGTPSGSSGPGG